MTTYRAAKHLIRRVDRERRQRAVEAKIKAGVSNALAAFESRPFIGYGIATFAWRNLVGRTRIILLAKDDLELARIAYEAFWGEELAEPFVKVKGIERQAWLNVARSFRGSMLLETDRRGRVVSTAFADPNFRYLSGGWHFEPKRAVKR